MVTLRPMDLECAGTLKAVRLSALLDTPTAFGSTYAVESQWSEAEWERRAAQWQSDRSTCYLAWDGDRACGIVAGFIDQADSTTAHLVSMWVAPEYRRCGVGQSLVESILEWARSRGVNTLVLTVTSNNDTAARFYERLGFAPTGQAGPYRNDPTLSEFVMSRPSSGPIEHAPDPR